MSARITRRVIDIDRFQLVELLGRGGLIGIELGVASGDFSRRMVHSGLFSDFFGVDAYADHHDAAEYVSALASVGVFSRYKLLRMRFDEALPLFKDESFDLVYIDGYAHTGQEDGGTIFSWLPKVRVGGILAGHDYHRDWPLVMASVDDLCHQTGFELLITRLSFNPGPQDLHPSWAIIKTKSVSALSSGSFREPRARGNPVRCAVDDPFHLRARQALRLLAGSKGIALFRRLVASGKSASWK
jgi:hypothetical protein